MQIYLAQFIFITGDIPYTLYRNVILTGEDVTQREIELKREPSSLTDQEVLDIAYDKFNARFPKEYPESKLESVIIYPAIE